MLLEGGDPVSRKVSLNTLAYCRAGCGTLEHESTNYTNDANMARILAARARAARLAPSPPPAPPPSPSPPPHSPSHHPAPPLQVEYDNDPEKAHAFGQDWSASLDAFAQEPACGRSIEPPTAEGAVPAARGFPNSSYSDAGADLVKRGLEPREWMIDSTKMARARDASRRCSSSTPPRGGVGAGGWRASCGGWRWERRGPALSRSAPPPSRRPRSAAADGPSSPSS